MNYRNLGNTALQISVLGFGASPLGDVYGATTAPAIQGAVDAAIEQGINFFDCSPYYGLTLAEERLGAALVRKRQQVVLATKCGRYGVDSFDFSRASLRRSVDESLRRLRTDYVDLLQAHDVEFAPERQILEETIPALRELQAEGKARYIGITGYPVHLLRRIAERVPVDSVLSYCRYSLLNTDMLGVLAPLAEGGAPGLINASPLMMGLLTDQGPPTWHSASEALKQAGRRAAEAARSCGVTIAQLALQFSLEQTFAATTLIGMSTADEVVQNVRAASRKVNGEALRAVRVAIGNGFATTWNSGLPENCT